MIVNKAYLYKYAKISITYISAIIWLVGYLAITSTLAHPSNTPWWCIVYAVLFLSYMIIGDLIKPERKQHFSFTVITTMINYMIFFYVCYLNVMLKQ